MDIQYTTCPCCSKGNPGDRFGRTTLRSKKGQPFLGTDLCFFESGSLSAAARQEDDAGKAETGQNAQQNQRAVVAGTGNGGGRCSGGHGAIEPIFTAGGRNILQDHIGKLIAGAEN